MRRIYFPKNKISNIIFSFAGIFIIAASFILFEKEAKAADENPPVILPRSIWDNTKELNDMLSWLPDRKNTAPPDYAKVERIVIHDTGCSLSSPACNSDAVEQIAVIQSIYRSHTIFRGWGDIGYNYIIDRKGNIYEGRFGGNGVRGAHTYYDRKCMNFNVGTAGIVLLGNYSKQDMPEAMYKSLAKLTAWIGANNNIKPDDLKRTTPVWFNPKKDNGKCDMANGSFGTAFSGPAVAGHGDVEAGNPDPGVVDLNRVRTEAAASYSAFKKTAYRVAGVNSYWLIENGERMDFASEENLRSAGYADYSIKNISASQLEFYPLHSTFRYPDGTLIKAKDGATVYMVEEGKKRPLNISAKEFESLGFKWDQIVILIPKDMSVYPDGNPVKFAGPEGELITGADSKIFRIESGRKRWVTSLMLFESLAYEWDKIKSVSKDEISGYLEGAWMIYPDNNFIKGSDGKVYKIAGGERHLVTSLALFDKLKLKWSKIKTIADSEVDAIKEGAPLVYPDGLLVKSADDPKTYLIKDAKKHLISSDYLFKKLGYSGKNVLKINNEEIAALPEAEPVKYPDGSLLKPIGGSEVYAIEKGKRRWIQTSAEFNKKKYSWKNVIAVAPGELAYYSLMGKAPASSAVIIPAIPAPTSAIVPVPVATPSPAPVAIVTPVPRPTATPVVSAPNTANPPVIAKEIMRVAIYSPASGEKVDISADGAYYAKNYSGKNELVSSIKKSRNEITSVNYFTDGYWRFEPENNAIMKIVTYSDIPAWDKTLNDNIFEGTIEIKYSSVSNKLWVINELSLEDYVDGIGEALNSDYPEYLKAFSLAARTYAKFYINKGGKYAGEPFFLKNSRNGNGNDQIYRGYGFIKRAANILSANRATSGEIIIFNGKPIVAAYSSDSGGVTKDACAVLTQNYCTADYSYLRGGVKDPDATRHNASIVAISHGAGISAVGARQMAKEGSKYQEIISRYYPGTKIEKIY
ncbi:MAG: N-acetylmuramoyl-L-alanine amidase [Candidatus Omnitrophica bacterium]|nr:N-acetylmuramoyl-L-alanine amidase [Candidatus Omnitrophota bacterium]